MGLSGNVFFHDVASNLLSLELWSGRFGNEVVRMEFSDASDVWLMERALGWAAEALMRRSGCTSFTNWLRCLRTMGVAIRTKGLEDVIASDVVSCQRRFSFFSSEMTIQRHRWMHPGLALYRAFSLHPSTRHIHTSSLDTEILALSSWYSPLPHELLVRCHLPTLLFSNSLPQTAFRIHGSTSTRTCLPDSDSICPSPCLLKSNRRKPAIFNSPIFASTQHRDRNLATLTHISKILSSLPLDTPKLIKSSTPHILTQDRQTLIPIDISLNTTTKRDIFISSLPFHYLSTFFAVKALLRVHGLNDASKGGIGSYALHLLIHHF
ncbi:hypothetical protein BC829DRAFT_124542 [Chytridium lagenaria]|nr:hypothetical protein BC829DRAFT_124542 [Chytridium lagenaria]